MLERALPIRHSEVALGQDLAARESANVREFVRDIWSRLLRLLRALADFFASGGPLS
jgi:hypothetical protein